VKEIRKTNSLHNAGTPQTTNQSIHNAVEFRRSDGGLRITFVLTSDVV